MPQARHFRRCERGMTLVELLMVITIMTVLMAVAIPMVRPAFRDRQLREAARQVNIFFAGAKARAAESGRPVGVWMEVQADPDGPKYATQLHMAEVAPSYTGSMQGERCTVVETSPRFGRLQFIPPVNEDYFKQLFDVNHFLIRFDHKGPWYECSRDDQELIIRIPRGIPRGTEPDSYPRGQTFEIRLPPRKSIGTPITLPGDAVIDLTVSGIGVRDARFTGASPGTPIILMFNPTGELRTVYVNNQPMEPTGSVYLMIGRRGKVGNRNAADPEVSNLADPGNMWLTINSRTGAVTTEDNAATSPTADLGERIRSAREFARGSRQKGGR